MERPRTIAIRGNTPMPTGPPVENPPPDPTGRSIIEEPFGTGWGSGYSYAVMYQMATVADDFPAWGSQPYMRDQKLRQFWPTEPIFASTFGAIVQKYSSFEWEIMGDDVLVDAYTDMLNACQDGKGWKALISRTAVDMYTQDNGAFWELIRSEDSPNSPVLTMNHLDSARCIRTGLRNQPIWYRDIRGGLHQMKWYQVSELTEMPSPIEDVRGLQTCALTRMLRAAQLAKDIGVYHREKLSGRFAGQIHFVGGIQRAAIETALKIDNAKADTAGLARYISPIIVSSLDPDSTISKETIDLASLPDAFDFEQHMFWYMNNFANAFGTDYMEVAPLPGKGATGGAATISHTKSTGKGASSFMDIITQVMNYHGIIARTAKFKFKQMDNMASLEHADLIKSHMQTIQVGIMAGVLTPPAGRMMLQEMGDLSDDIADALEADPLTPKVLPQSFPGGPPIDGGKMPNGNTAQPGGGGNTEGRSGTGQSKPSKAARVRDTGVGTRQQRKKDFDPATTTFGVAEARWDDKDEAELQYMLARKRLEEVYA